MKAILTATGHPVCTPGDRHLPPLLPLMDRPVLQHAVELLAAWGVKEIDVLLCLEPEKFRAILGDGKRWGVSITTHLIRNPDQPFGRIRTLGGGPAGELVLLASADRLPLGIEPPGEQSSARQWTAPDGAWSGWALVPRGALDLLTDQATEHDAAGLLNTAPVPAPQLLDARTFAGLLAAHRAVGEHRAPGLMLTGTEAEPGIWLSRNVELHPTAKIQGPVYLGADVRIGARAEIGPHATIGAGCVLDEGCMVRDGVVMPGTYVGPDLEVCEAVVDRCLLVSVRAGAAIRITDEFMLGNLQRRRQGRPVRRMVEWLLVFLLTLMLSPLLILRLLFALPGWRSTRAGRAYVRQPAEEDESAWKTTRLFDLRPAQGSPTHPLWSHGWNRMLPGLLDVLAGRCMIVGMEARTAEELNALAPDHRALALGCSNGLISEQLVAYPGTPGPDEQYSADAFYAQHEGLAHDLGLTARYFIGLLRELQGRGSVPFGAVVSGE